MAQIIQIGDEFYVEYKAQGLTFRKKAGANREEAEKLLAFIESNSGPEEYIHQTSHDVDRKTYEEEFLSEIRAKFSSQTLSRFQDAVSQLDGFLTERYGNIVKIHHITPKIIQDFFAAHNDHLAAHLLSYAFDLARGKGYISDNPFFHLAIKPSAKGKIPRALRGEEATRLLAAADGSFRAIISLLMETGVRVEELVSLPWAQVDLKDPSICIQSYQGRIAAQDTRKVPLTGQAVLILNQQADKRGKSSDRVFSGLDADTVKESIDGFIKRASLSPDITFNSLRHTFAQSALARGIGLVRLSQFLGMDDIFQVMTYESFLPEKVSRI